MDRAELIHLRQQTAAILVGHGSIHNDSGKSMIRIAARLQEQEVSPIVEAGFLNFNQPTIADAIQKACERGATHCVIQPYFLIDGQYAARDLPARMEEIAAEHDLCAFTIAGTLGYHNALVQLAQKRIQAVDPVPQPPTALLLVAHGTPWPQANQPIYRVATTLGKLFNYEEVSVAFLDCNQPTIPAAIARLVLHGYRRIIIHPYFLHLGRHVRTDLPALFAQAREEHPGVTIIAAHHLDYDPLLVTATADRITAAMKDF